MPVVLTGHPSRQIERRERLDIGRASSENSAQVVKSRSGAMALMTRNLRKRDFNCVNIPLIAYGSRDMFPRLSERNGGSTESRPTTADGDRDLGMSRGKDVKDRRD